MPAVSHRKGDWRKAFADLPGDDNRGGSTEAGAPIFHRTILLRDLTVGNDIADHVTVHGAGGTAFIVIGDLRKTIASNLTLRIKCNGTTVGTFTIPSSTAVDSVVQFRTFTNASLPYLGVFTWDVTAGDGSKDAAGVASFTICWK